MIRSISHFSFLASASYILARPSSSRQIMNSGNKNSSLIKNDDHDVIVSYVSDVEGNLNYWNNFKKISKVLTLKESSTLDLKENCHLVFGGFVYMFK